MAHGVIGREDCLVANVFTAGIPNSPIMLQIHGGSMNAGPGRRRRLDPGEARQGGYSIDPVPPRGPGILGGERVGTPKFRLGRPPLRATMGKRQRRRIRRRPETRHGLWRLRWAAQQSRILLTTAPPGLIFARSDGVAGRPPGLDGAGEPARRRLRGAERAGRGFIGHGRRRGMRGRRRYCLRKVPNADIITAAEGVRFAPSRVREPAANPLSADGVETPLALLRLGAWQQGALIVGGQPATLSSTPCAAAVALAGPPRNLTHFEFVDALQTYFAGSRIAWT